MKNPTSKPPCSVMRGLGLSIIASLLFAFPAFSGSCANHIRVSQIGNIEVDTDGNVILNPKVVAYGNTWGTTTKLSATGHLYVPATATTLFRNHALATLQTALATGQIVVAQVVVEGNTWFRIEKVSVGTNQIGLDCHDFAADETRP